MIESNHFSNIWECLLFKKLRAWAAHQAAPDFRLAEGNGGAADESAVQQRAATLDGADAPAAEDGNAAVRDWKPAPASGGGR
jgi:hypothetical protein